MITPQFNLPIHGELVVDLFAGGGGASTGIEQAIGLAVDIAINHDPEAISLHQANHPQTQHFCSDVFEVDPIVVTQGMPVGLLWASPDCKHFSKAKGGKPVSKKIRSLAWVVVKWAKAVRPRMIFLENVEEFQTWGPIGEDGRPCPDGKGKTFKRWKQTLENMGYVVEHKELKACDYGTPTIRKRLFLVARCDGQPIEWPAVTHGDPKRIETKAHGLRKWRTAAECIDWSIPVPSIFDRKKELAEATCKRIAKGIMRYVVGSADPFIAPVGAAFLPEHANASSPRVFAANEPLRTQCANVKGGHFSLVVPTLVQTGYGEREGQAPRALDIGKPIGTMVGSQKHALVSAFLAKHYTGVVGSAMPEPIGTVTSVDHHSLVTANLIHYHSDKRDGDVRASDLREPIKTQTTENRHALVSSFLIKYYGNERDGVSLAEPMHTLPTKDRMGLVMVRGEQYAIVDIGLRMLTPKELYAAQGFPNDYRIDKGADGKPLTKTAQVRMCGNSVCPPMAKVLVEANYFEREVRKVA